MTSHEIFNLHSQDGSLYFLAENDLDGITRSLDDFYYCNNHGVYGNQRAELKTVVSICAR